MPNYPIMSLPLLASRILEAVVFSMFDRGSGSVLLESFFKSMKKRLLRWTPKKEYQHVTREST
jgi:hypothetical protein